MALCGSSIYTLGFEVPPNLPTTVLAFSKAGLGLDLLALLISRSPPTATAMLIRVSVIGGWDRLEELWRDWERWVVEVAETTPPCRRWSSSGPRTRSTRG